MSRSKRKTKIFGHAHGASDKPYKQQEHRAERRAASQALSTGSEDVHTNKLYGNPWASVKDGKQYFADATDKDMRK